MRCRVFRRVCVGILSLSLLVTGMPFCSGGAKTQAAGVQSGVTEKMSVAKEKSGSITVDGNDIRANNVNGLTYKGFGLLSANSTSDTRHRIRRHMQSFFSICSEENIRS